MLTKKDILKLESLLYLYALSKSSSKREVARQMGSSVDTVNKYLTDLESDLHTRFLISGGRGTIITPEGKRVLELTENIVKTMRQIDDYSCCATAYCGVVRLSMTDAIADYLGSEKIFDFMRQYPDIRLETALNGKLPDLNTMEADIFIGYEPHDSPDTVIITSKEIACGLYAAPRYLKTYGNPQSLEDLIANHRLCDKTEHHLYAPGWKDIIDKARHVVYRTNSIISFNSHLNEGVGIGICPVFYGNRHLHPIVNVNFKFNLKFYLMAHKDTKDMPRIRVVLDYLKEMIESKPNW